MSNKATIDDLVPDAQNPRTHGKRNIEMIADSLRDVGPGRSIVIDEDNIIVAGNGVVQAAAEVSITNVRIIEATGTELIAVRLTGLTPEQKRRLSYFDNKTAELAGWNADQIAIDLENNLDLSGIFLDTEIAGILEQAADDILDSALEDDLTRQDVPDAMWPTDNEWGIPLLDINLQAKALELPIAKWGAIARTSKMTGTYQFYCDDYRFNALWADPSPVVNSSCAAIVEPNFSTGEQMAKAVALWGVYRKRWLARYWQSFGIKIFVDINVEAVFADLNMLGIPEGWTAYATRWLDSYGHDDRMMQWEMAKKHAGTDSILFAVFGGRDKAEAACKEHGWLWIREHAAKVNDGH